MRARIDTALLFAATLWCAAIILTPVFSVTPAYVFFSLICHQDPGRSWHLLGKQLPVCIRCASIYFGFLIALAVKREPDVRWLKVAIGATVLEFCFERTVMNSVIARSMTGLLLGAVAAPFVLEGVREMLRGERRAV